MSASARPELEQLGPGIYAAGGEFHIDVGELARATGVSVDYIEANIGQLVAEILADQGVEAEVRTLYDAGSWKQ